MKCAIIGFGKIAETAHALAYLSKEIAEKIEIVAVADPSEERLNSARKLFPNAILYKSFGELFDNETLDYADICVPPHLHKAVIERAVENNVHILCEKPLANSLEEALEIDKLIRTKDIVFVPCHQYKYAPVWKLFAECVKKINDAKIYLQFDVIRLHADNGFDEKNQDWRTNSAISGGGIIVDTGVHYLYLLLSMLGVPNDIQAKLITLKHSDYGVEDSSFIQATFDKGLAQINLTWAGNKRFNSAMLVSSSASLFYDGKDVKLNDEKGERIISVPDMSDKKTYISLYAELFEDLISRINKKNSSFDLLEESTNAMKLLELAKESNRINSTVEFR